MKRIFILTLVIAAIFSATSCKKEGPQGETGPAGPAGPDAKTYTKTLTFNAGSTFASFDGISNFDANDVLLFYVYYENLGGEKYYAPIPADLFGVTYIPEFNENTGIGFINTFTTGTQNSPWPSSANVMFKIVHIKSSGLIKHPNVDYSNYEEVKKAFDL